LQGRLARALVPVAVASLLAAAPSQAQMPLAAADPIPIAERIRSGIDLSAFDTATRPQDDFYQSVNGAWIARAEIPADKSSWSAFAQLADETQAQVREIVEEAAAAQNPAEGSAAQQIGSLYRSFMDEARAEALGSAPIREELARIDALHAPEDLPQTFARMIRMGIMTPFDFSVGPDARQSSHYAVYLEQRGLGLPDRDYYLQDEDARLKQTRLAYRQYLERLLGLLGRPDPAAEAGQVLALETAIAKVQWTKVENRDPVKTYNKITVNELGRLSPGFGWAECLRAAGLEGKAEALIVGQPSYFQALAGLISSTPTAAWQAYLRTRLASSLAPYLSSNFVNTQFAFYGTSLRGIPQNEPRWKRAVRLTERAAGERVGRLYVERFFPEQSKARMAALVGHLIEAYRRSIRTLDWMGPQTRREALAKLDRLNIKIGYPDRWRDYSKLRVAADDLVGNVLRSRAFEYERDLAKLGGPIDRTEWLMNPQTVNAYYNPEMNEIVFPAAILQPPFFNRVADDAVNYGAIGAVIGHEISHGFDDAGARYDAEGNLREWWTAQDHQRFEARTAALVAQYDAYSPLPGYHVNGKLTLGENIADNAGLAIAYKAYRLALAGQSPPRIAGLTGDQRFYMGWAQIYRAKIRDEQALVALKSDPHSPAKFRGNGAVVNQAGFARTFGLKPGDRMYLAPDRRISLW
jgi:predicted metalloendopeptidase